LAGWAPSASPPGARACAAEHPGDPGEGRHRSRAEGEQGTRVGAIRGSGAPGSPVLDPGVEDQVAEDRQAPLQGGLGSLLPARPLCDLAAPTCDGPREFRELAHPFSTKTTSWALGAPLAESRGRRDGV